MEKNYTNYAVGNFREEVANIKEGIERVPTKEIIGMVKKELSDLVSATEASDMGNGHGQKEIIYKKVIEVYQLILDKVYK